MSRPRGPSRRYRNMDRAKADEIRRAYFAREGTQKAIGERHGIGQNTVSRIISGIVWS
jgi:DNA-directed RNA polymerase specialized sigma subunit